MSTCFDAVLFVVALMCDVLKAERKIFLRQAKDNVRWFYKLVERVYRLKDTWRSFDLGAAVIHYLIGKEWGRGFSLENRIVFRENAGGISLRQQSINGRGCLPRPLDQNNNYSLMSTKRKCSPLPFIDIKTVVRVWKLFSVTQKASLRFFFILQLSSIPLSTLDTSELRLPPLENSVNRNKKVNINGEAHMLCSSERKDGMIKDDRLPRYKIDSSCQTTAADRVDRASRFLFPVFFVIYNIVYWAVYALPGKKLE